MTHRIDDILLMAYVDGEVDGDTAREIEAAAASDPAIAARMRAFRDTAVLARSALAEALHEPVPERLLAVIGPVGNRPASVPWTRRPWAQFLTGWWPAYSLAASLALVVIAIGTGNFGPVSQERVAVQAALANRGWLDNVVGSYRVYAKTLAKEERLLVDFNAEDIPELQKWFGSRLERDLDVPDFSGNGFTTQGGRLLVLEGRPAAQLVYYSERGELVALVIAFSNTPDQGLEATRRSDVNIVHWRRGGYAYALVGDIAPKLLRTLATIASSKLEPT